MPNDLQTARLRSLADAGEASFAPRRSPGSTGKISRPAPLDRLRPALSILAVIALPASADTWSTASNQWSGGSSFAPRPAPQQTALPGSSFHGVEVRSSFDLVPRSQPPGGKRAPFVMPKGNDELEKVRAVIFHAESRQHGYDAYNLAASIPPPRPASTMTLREIQQWTRDTPGQQHAIGRYQIIPSTLNRLIARTGLALDTVFAPNIQDAFANVLIIDAGYLALKDGSLSLDAFKVELAKVWAGLPLPSGKSYYAGVAGNKATISYRNYSAYMAQIFPVEAQRGLTPARVVANPKKGSTEPFGPIRPALSPRAGESGGQSSDDEDPCGSTPPAETGSSSADQASRAEWVEPTESPEGQARMRAQSRHVRRG